MCHAALCCFWTHFEEKSFGLLYPLGREVVRGQHNYLVLAQRPHFDHKKVQKFIFHYHFCCLFVCLLIVLKICGFKREQTLLPSADTRFRACAIRACVPDNSVI